MVEGAVILVSKIRRRRDLSRPSSCSHCRRRACCRDAVPLPGRFQRIGTRLRAVKITPIDKRCARCRGNQNRAKQEKREPFHALDSNRSAPHCQCPDAFTDMNIPSHRPGAAFSSCASLCCEENVSSVRGYGLRTCKPRQGRNAATVV